ncbi:MAG: radical SAM protein, partial [Pirellulales bacterium]
SAFDVCPRTKDALCERLGMSLMGKSSCRRTGVNGDPKTWKMSAQKIEKPGEACSMKSMKTLLVYPPFERLHGTQNRFFPIGLGYLAGALRRIGADVAIYNAENYDDEEGLISGYRHTDVFKHHQDYQDALDDPDHYVWREVEQVLADYDADIIGITVKSCMIPSAQAIARIAKQLNPNVTVVWGGPHPSICPEDTIQFDNVDFVVRHEGEETIKQFVTMVESGRKNWSEIDGLVWKNEAGDIVQNELRTNMQHVDEVDLPDKSVDLMPARYSPDDLGVMFTSRGCPWPCTFCDSVGVWTRQIRYHSPEHIIDEMVRIYEHHGVRDFYFWDDTFTPNRKHSMRLFDMMIETFQAQGRPITWVATTRCDLVDDELARKMKESGCRLLTFGIETGSPSMMKILRKGITHEKVDHCSKVMQKAGITWEAFFMMGFPDETLETAEETMELIRKLGVVVAISLFTPYPGTEMYERAKSYGLLEEPIAWRHFSHQSPKNHFVKNVSREVFSKVAFSYMQEIDNLNHKRYVRNRIGYYLKNPKKLPTKLLDMMKQRALRVVPSKALGRGTA